MFRPLEKHSSWTTYELVVVCLQLMLLQLLPVPSSNPSTLPRLLRREAWLRSFLLLLWRLMDIATLLGTCNSNFFHFTCTCYMAKLVTISDKYQDIYPWSCHPGSWITFSVLSTSEYEEVFASSQVQYYGQALGLIVADSKVSLIFCFACGLCNEVIFSPLSTWVAEFSPVWVCFRTFLLKRPHFSCTWGCLSASIGLHWSILPEWQRVADDAAKLVDVEYTDIQKPILTFDDAIAADSFFSERGIDWESGESSPLLTYIVLIWVSTVVDLNMLFLAICRKYKAGVSRVRHCCWGRGELFVPFTHRVGFPYQFFAMFS